MIEINLLPEDLRQTEGTPLPRLVAILGSVVVACGLGVLVAFFYMVYIPRVNDDIKVTQSEIENLKKKVDEVNAKDAEIHKLTDKNNTLNNLNDGRMRYGRLLDKLAYSVVGLEGVWFKTFTITADAGSGAPGVPTGKRYKIALSGTILGENLPAMTAKFVELSNNIKTQFSIPKEDDWHASKPGDQRPERWGFSKELGARFYPPANPEFSTGRPAAPVPLSGGTLSKEALEKLAIPETGLDFRFDMVFEMPPPK